MAWDLEPPTLEPPTLETHVVAPENDQDMCSCLFWRFCRSPQFFIQSNISRCWNEGRGLQVTKQTRLDNWSRLLQPSFKTQVGTLSYESWRIS